MITIEQLLESVDLDFEPRWIAKDGNGDVYIFEHTPEIYEPTKQWETTVPASGLAGYEGLKLAEFENKDWQECIYEVPRKTTGKIEKLPEFDRTEASIFHAERLYGVVNELVDAVNKHADIIQQIGDWGTRKGECLWCEKITSVNLEK